MDQGTRLSPETKENLICQYLRGTTEDRQKLAMALIRPCQAFLEGQSSSPPQELVSTGDRLFQEGDKRGEDLRNFLVSADDTLGSLIEKVRARTEPVTPASPSPPSTNL